MKIGNLDDSAVFSKKTAFKLTFSVLLVIMVVFIQTSLSAQNEPGNGLAESVSSAGAPDVSPTEDLMREHGLLERILLVYQEILTRMDKGSDFPIETLQQSAGIVRHFVEDYHEKLEEEHIFPRFEKAAKLADLTKTLRRQHDAGWKLTDSIISNSTADALNDQAGRRKLTAALRSFIRMYRPHKSREDTILFPALHDLVSKQEFDKMGDMFEDREKDLFGDRGFEKNVEKVAEIEKKLGIYELDSFTAR